MAITSQSKLLLVSIACVQNFLAGGLIYGWAGISGSLLSATPSKGGAGLTSEECTCIFSSATFINFTSPLILGIILDRYGPRICSVLSNATVAFGCYFFAVADNFNGYTFAAVMIAFGGPGVQNSCIHLGSLFPDNRAMVMSFITGFMSLSMIVFPVMDIVWNMYGVGLGDLFRSYAVVLVVSAWISVFFWDDTVDVHDDQSASCSQYEKQGLGISSEDGTALSLKTCEHSWSNCNVILQTDCRSVRIDDDIGIDSLVVNERNCDCDIIAQGKELRVMNLSIFTQLRNARFFHLLLFFVVTTFSANLYVGSITTELGDSRYFSTAQQNWMAQVFTVTTAFGAVVAPVMGFIIDKWGFVAAALLTAAFGIIQMLLLLLGNGSTPTVLTSFLFYSLFRCSTFRYFFAFIFMRMGSSSFGRLVGIAFAISGMTQPFLKYVALWAAGTCHLTNMDGCNEGRWRVLHLFQIIALLLITVVVVCFEWIECSSKETSQERAKDFRGSEKKLLCTVGGSTYGTVERACEER